MKCQIMFEEAMKFQSITVIINTHIDFKANAMLEMLTKMMR